MFLGFFLFLTIISFSLANPTTTYRPRPPRPLDNSPASTSTGYGSYFEYAVRNVIRNIPAYYPRTQTDNNITDVEQMVYYYHLQMMHIDLLWAQNWVRQHRTDRYPEIFELPSRAVKYFYNTEVPYIFGDGLQRTLDSHRLACDECNRQFYCNVNHVHNHLVNRFFRNPQPMFERRSTVPYFVIQLEESQRSANLPLFLPTPEVTDMITNQPLVPPIQNCDIEAAPVMYSTSSSTTDGYYFYKVERDELKKKKY